MYIFLTFHKLAKMLFEPLFFVALAGVLLALCRNWQRRDWRFYLLTGGMIFMLLWRSGIALMSKRYVEIMVFPGLAFAAYFIYKFPICLYIWCRPWLRRQGWRSRRWVRGLSSLFLVAMLAILAAKLSRYNRFDAALISGCTALTQDRVAYPNSRIYEHGFGSTRFRYYTKTAVVELPENQELVAIVREIPQCFTAKVAVIYWCCKEKKVQPQLPELLGEPAGFTVHRIFSSPLSNRQEHYLNIYRLKRN